MTGLSHIGGARPPRIEKRHIIDIVKVGKVFTFNATRHIIPARPHGVEFPLSHLKDQDISVEKANRKLSDFLKAKVLRRFSLGQIWWGRRYYKALYVLRISREACSRLLGRTPAPPASF